MTPASALLLELMDGIDPAVPLPESLCRLAATKLPVTAVSMVLTGASGVAQAVAASDDRAAALEDLQLLLGEGPLHDVVRTRRLVQQPDLARTGPVRWPHFTDAARHLGVESMFSFPLVLGGIRLGVLDLFADVPTVLEDADLALALHVVDAAVLVVLHLSDEDPVSTTPRVGVSDAMTEAFRSYAVVHQATGMVSVQAGVGLVEALLLIRASAYSANVSIIAVSEDVVTGSAHFG